MSCYHQVAFSLISLIHRQPLHPHSQPLHYPRSISFAHNSQSTHYSPRSFKNKCSSNCHFPVFLSLFNEFWNIYIYLIYILDIITFYTFLTQSVHVATLPLHPSFSLSILRADLAQMGKIKLQRYIHLSLQTAAYNSSSWFSFLFLPSDSTVGAV